MVHRARMGYCLCVAEHHVKKVSRRYLSGHFSLWFETESYGLLKWASGTYLSHDRAFMAQNVPFLLSSVPICGHLRF